MKKFLPCCEVCRLQAEIFVTRKLTSAARVNDGKFLGWFQNLLSETLPDRWRAEPLRLVVNKDSESDRVEFEGLGVLPQQRVNQPTAPFLCCSIETGPFRFLAPLSLRLSGSCERGRERAQSAATPGRRAAGVRPVSMLAAR